MTALFKTELKWGILFSAMMLAWLCMEFFTGLHTTYKDLYPIVTNLVIFPALLIFGLALNDVRKTLGGYMTWLQAIRSGAIIALIGAALWPALQYLFYTQINPTFFEDFIRFAMESGQAKTEEYVRGILNLRYALISSTFTSFMMGLMNAAVMGYFTKKDPPATAE